MDGEFHITGIMVRDGVKRKEAIRRLARELDIVFDRERGGWIHLSDLYRRWDQDDRDREEWERQRQTEAAT